MGRSWESEAKKKRKDNVGVLLRRLDKTHHGKPVSLPATNISMPPTISHTLFLGVELATDQLRAVLLDDQLDILGVSSSHLPSRSPFTMSISPARPRPNVGDKRASRTISQPALVACFHDKEAFYELYNALTNKAIDLYARAGRRKFALKLHGSLAALDVYATLLSLTVCKLLMRCAGIAG